jgi:excisionase family DNA binding protein
MGYMNNDVLPISSDEDIFYSVKKSAKYLCISRQSLYRLVNEGRLPAYRITGLRLMRFKKHDLDKLIEKVEGPITIEPKTNT